MAPSNTTNFNQVKGVYMLKVVLLSTAALALAATTTVAFAAPADVALSKGGAMTVFQGKPVLKGLEKFTPPPKKSVIFSTLGSGNNYDGGEGWTVANPGAVGFQQWVAFAITPTSNVTATEIAVAAGYVEGANSVTVELLSDDGGVPGSVLEKKTVKNLQTFGDCCAVAVDKLKSGVALTAGTTYWVAEMLPSKKQADTWDAWNLSSSNTNDGQAATNTGSGWGATELEYGAFAVYGK